MFPIFISLFLTVVLLHFHYRFLGKVGAGMSNLPPAPSRSLPLIGHFFCLRKDPHKVIMECSKQLGPVLTLQFGSFRVVAINNGDLIKQAFRSSALSGRPRLKLFDELTLNRQGMVMSDGPGANELRHFYLQHLKGFTNDGDTLSWRVLEEVRSFLHRLDSLQGSPCQVNGIFHRNVVNVLLSILMGHRFEDDEDDQVKSFAHMITDLTRIPNFMEFLGMYLPVLSKLCPGVVGYKKRFATRDRIFKFLQPIIEEHRRTKATGQPRDIMDSYLDRSEETIDVSSPFHHNTDSLVVSLAEIFCAAMETNSVQLEWIVYYIAKHPEIQKKMQAEIDHVLGSREPSLSDRADLPYVEAVILETLRTPTSGPFGVLHSVLADFELGGCLIPKDTIVLTNMYAAHHDPEVWGDPESFRPERFVNDCETPQPPGCKKDNLIAYGCGKRSCVGETLARNQLFLFTVSIFQKFFVRPCAELPNEQIFGMLIEPGPFKVNFIPRCQN